MLKILVDCAGATVVALLVTAAVQFVFTPGQAALVGLFFLVFFLSVVAARGLGRRRRGP